MPTALDHALNPTRSLPSPWASIPSTPNGYIAGANGENVIKDYQRGGKYSSYPDARTGVISDSYVPSPTGHYVGTGQAPDLATLASGGQNHYQAWTSGSATPVKIQGPFPGMPDYLAKIAQKNLTTADNQINAFNEKARLFSYGSAHSDIPPKINAPVRQTVLQGSALDRGAYDRTNNTAVKSAVGVEDQRIASANQEEEY